MSDKNTPILEIGDDGKLYSVVYDENGKEISRKQVYVMPEKPPPRTYYKRGEFALMSKLFMKMLATKKNYSNLTFRLFFILYERIEFDNRIATFRQVELANELETRQPHVSDSLKVLLNDNVIEKRGHDYYFTNKFVSFANARKTKDELPKSQEENHE